MNRKRQAGGYQPSAVKRPDKSMPGRSYPKGLKPSTAGSRGKATPPGAKKKAQMGGSKLPSKNPEKIGIEPNKEITFGKPNVPKSDYSKGEYQLRKKKVPGLPSQPKKYKAQGGAFAERVTRAKEREAGIDNSSLTSSGFTRSSSSSGSGAKSKVDSKGNQMIGTDADIKKMESMKAKSKSSGSYSEAKKRDSNLDSYIKARNSAAKGSREYNEAQNKINRAYGKGPIREVEPAKTASTGKSAATAMASQSKPQTATLQTRSKPTPPPPAPKSKKEQRTDKKVARVEGRKNKREDNAADRSFARNERKGERADNKQSRLDRRDRIREAKGKQPRQKAQAGALVAGGGQALKGVGSLVNAIAGKDTKFGNIASSVGDVAGGIGSMMGPDGAAVNKVGGALNNAAAGAAGAAGAGAAPGVTPDANTSQPVPNPENQPMRRGGKKKGKKGMMKYKAGGAKPDYLDMDKDGNKTESMRSALKDRRKRRGGRR